MAVLLRGLGGMFRREAGLAPAASILAAGFRRIKQLAKRTDEKAEG